MPNCLMNEISEAKRNAAGLRGWERTLLVRRSLDAMYAIKEHPLADGAFDDSPELDHFLLCTSNMVTTIAQSDQSAFLGFLTEIEQLLETMGWLVRMRERATIEH